MINESNDTTRSQKNVLRENLALTHTARSRTRLCVTQRKVTTSRKQFFYLRETGACVLFFDFYRNTEQ